MEDEDVEVVVVVIEVSEVVVCVDEVVEGVLVGLVSGGRWVEVDDTDVVVDDVVLGLVVLELVVVVVEVLRELTNGRETETLKLISLLLLGSELQRFTVNTDRAICTEFMSSIIVNDLH